MIESIYIRNFGIVEETEFKPSSGFSVITGETGAGKSMIIGAISLLMGQRFNGGLMPNPEQKSILEITLQADISQLHHIFRNYDIEEITPIIVRREINSLGRSRTFINDTPVPIAALKEVFHQLIDLSEQHENLSLSRRDAKIDFIDGFAKNDLLIENYKKVYFKRKDLHRQIIDNESELQKLLAEQDYFLYQLEELEKINYLQDEEKDLESELETLEHAEEIKQSLYSAYKLFVVDENGIISQLENVIQSLKPAANHHRKASQITDRLREFYYELKEIGTDLENEFDEIEFNPARLEEVELRLTSIYKLVKKHNLLSANDLLQLKSSFNEKLQSYDDLQKNLNILKSSWDGLDKEFLELSLNLTESRQTVKHLLEMEIENKLHFLAMPDARFKIEISKSEACHELGCDEVELYFTANKGVELQPLTKIASGGELSRLMLSIKSILGKKRNMPTLIFDEIDTGISGETATKVGNMMSELAKTTQLIVISHLPQIAAKASHHFLVEKINSNDKTLTQIRQIETNERINVLATMLSGDKDSENAKRTATEMLTLNSLSK